MTWVVSFSTLRPFVTLASMACRGDGGVARHLDAVLLRLVRDLVGRARSAVHDGGRQRAREVEGSLHGDQGGDERGGSDREVSSAASSSAASATLTRSASSSACTRRCPATRRS